MEKWKNYVYRVKEIIESSRKNKISLNMKRLKLKEKLVQENSKMEKIGNISLENKIFLEKMNNLKNKSKNLHLSASELHSETQAKVSLTRKILWRRRTRKRRSGSKAKKKRFGSSFNRKLTLHARKSKSSRNTSSNSRKLSRTKTK